mmetsp:Transcript_28860/g.70366  ORF Transcript_28860/g.70366 Transcript_28860/m.70366 type:complete len:351 (+) Transcript_28860:1116-2168(+)
MEMGQKPHASLEVKILGLLDILGGEELLENLTRFFLALLKGLEPLSAGIHHSPREQSRARSKSPDCPLRVHKFQASFAGFQEAEDDSLVLHGIQRTCGVDHKPPRLQELSATKRNLELQRVQAGPVLRVPPRPDPRVLPHRAVPGARDVGQDAVEQEDAVVVPGAARRRFPPGWRGEQVGEELGLVVGDEEVRGPQPFDLFGEQVGAPDVGVVGDNNPLRQRRCPLRVKGFQQLARLRSGRGAHVEDIVVRLHVEEERGEHARGLLPANRSDVRDADEPLPERLQHGELADVFPPDLEVPGESVLIPRDFAGPCERLEVLLTLQRLEVDAAEELGRLQLALDVLVESIVL